MKGSIYWQKYILSINSIDNNLIKLHNLMNKQVLTFGLLFYMGSTQCEAIDPANKTNKCRALALRGGGTKGNY